ncbi:hypothetical protein HYQ45_015879 [Verticillium longisporum]|nr:Laminin subunit alpha-2 [Verticillium dahliae VDG2]KAF3360653.1 60S ribosomal export protein NMD3 [Verticillium dahliae VDG1]KAG7117396.1 hypothetical protein HYQ45_015879 [Verticillium longisporum]PNH26270.1 hypothetical protein BJF96_g10411 [Verticillium dahliae]PNH56480.1 hypothetical protein VD0003_g1217 [Verticillium dahliae]
MLAYDTLILGFGLFAGLAGAVGESKGGELYFMYKAYRSHKCDSWPEDFATDAEYQQSLAQGRQGCNLLGFMRQFSTRSLTGASLKAARVNVPDPWNPTLEQLFDVGEWGRTKNDDKFIYSKLNLVDVMGRAKPAEFWYPDPKSETPKLIQGDRYSFENSLASTGFIAQHQMTRQSTIAAPYITDMIEGLKWANHGRRKEEADRMVKDYIKAVKEIDPQASDKWVMTKPTKAVKPPEKIGTWGELDTKESYKAMKISKDGRAAVKELNKTYVKNYRNDGSEESHARVIAYTKNVRDQLLAATRPPCTGSCGICHPSNAL